jgi:lysine 2,3-aminomutase
MNPPPVVPGSGLTADDPTTTNEPPSIQHAPSVRIRRPSTPTPAFRRRHFPGISSLEWNDWRWQIRHRFRTRDQLSQVLRLAPDEEAWFADNAGAYPAGITPYYLSLISADDPQHPLRRAVIPSAYEFVPSAGEAEDPLGEDHDSPVPGLVHRYPDRALFLVHDACSTYCRYCTRSRMVGRSCLSATTERWQAMIDYIAATPVIRDVLLSGGDPLLLDDDQLNWILTRLRAIPHIEVLRIGTKTPAVLPQRITPALVRMLRRHHPLWMNLHFTHGAECTPEATRACGLLADAGIQLGSQTVLLAGINDSVPVMTDLVHRLVRMRVRPYYLYQCDPISGSGHFRTPVAKGLEIIRGLRGHTSGFCVPQYVIDAPGGGGKIPLLPDYNKGYEGGDLILENYENRRFRYHDPLGAPPAAAPKGGAHARRHHLRSA